MAGIFLLKMKKYCVFALILMFVSLAALCGCDDSTMSPWGDKDSQNNANKPQTYKVYVYGAVENEGYFEVSEGSTYFAAILQAGLLEQSHLTSFCETVVSDQQMSIGVQYTENGVVRDGIDANSVFFSLRLPWEGLSDEVVNKIADYHEEHGTIRNKTELRNVLGDEDYANYHYKLYIAEADYEEAD